MNNRTIKTMLLIFTIIYVIAPDLMPGPVDDLIVILLNMVMQNKLDTRTYETRY